MRITNLGICQKTLLRPFTPLQIEREERTTGWGRSADLGFCWKNLNVWSKLRIWEIDKKPRCTHSNCSKWRDTSDLKYRHDAGRG